MPSRLSSICLSSRFHLQVFVTDWKPRISQPEGAFLCQWVTRLTSPWGQAHLSSLQSNPYQPSTQYNSQHVRWRGLKIEWLWFLASTSSSLYTPLAVVLSLAGFARDLFSLILKKMFFSFLSNVKLGKILSHIKSFFGFFRSNWKGKLHTFERRLLTQVIL